MRTGLTVSAVFHLVLIGWGLISLSAFEPLDASQIEAMPIEFIEIDDETSTPLGTSSPSPGKKAPSSSGRRTPSTRRL